MLLYCLWTASIKDAAGFITMAIAHPPSQEYAPFTEGLPVYPATTEPTLTKYVSLIDGSLNPLEEGLVLPAPNLWDGIDSLHAQERVESWSPKGVKVGTFLKFKTMHDLTEAGIEFDQLLSELIEHGFIKLTTKQRSAWRVTHPIMRALSVDELPQVIYNVMGVGADRIPNRLPMSVVGSARPVLEKEIAIKPGDDNSNDMFAQALERVAEKIGADKDYRKMYAWIGRLYVPGLVTPATAYGNRQLSTPEGYDAWILGNIEYARIHKLPPVQRAVEQGRIILNSTKHVYRQTDAA
ncbi:MAG TPA: hypothetical protein VMR28_02915 [Candidatus Saccharimonadales bacterium]|nr:hypothetical protein [Candidatus Saccharimonadales bacterium]